MGNGVDVVPVDPAGRIAARQRGVVARQQLREAGLSERAIEYRLFENDRRRDADLLAAGYRVICVTWRQLTEQPEAVAVRLARVM